MSPSFAPFKPISDHIGALIDLETTVTSDGLGPGLPEMVRRSTHKVHAMLDRTIFLQSHRGRGRTLPARRLERCDFE